MIARLRTNPHWLVLAAILLLAAALRFYKIDAQSLWYDEGNSARIAERSVQLIVEGAAGDIHPPLYYIVLKFWRALFGDSEAGLRSFSAVCGVLTVWFAYLIGRDLFHRRVGLIAAFLLAVAPFAVYYGQEARMYSLLALCAAASTFSILDFGFSINVPPQSKIENRKSKIVLYVLATAAGLWTQYSYPFVMIAQGVVVILFAILDFRLKAPVGFSIGRRTIQNPKSKIQNLAIYAIASLIAILLFLPWVPIAIRQISGWGVAKQSYVLGDALLDALRTLIVGRTLLLGQAVLPMLVFGALMVVGVTTDDRRQTAEQRRSSSIIRGLSSFFLAFLPLALLFVFGLYRDAYLKVLLVCVLPMCMLAARGVEVLGHWVTAITPRRWDGLSLISYLFPTLLCLGIVTMLFPSLNNLYTNPAYARDDYRGIQRLISSDARPDDAVIFIAPNQWEVYTFYQKNDRNLFPLTYKPETYDQAVKQLDAIAKAHTRLFVLYFAERDADPDGWYEQWLGSNVNKAHEEWIGNIRLAVYSSGVRNATPWPDHESKIMFGDAIHLDNTLANLSNVHAGDVLPIDLVWHTDAKLDKRYKIFIHVGPNDGPPVYQNDGEPSTGIRPTNSWQPNETLIDRRGVWIRGGVTGDALGVFVGIYDAETGQRLLVSKAGQSVGDRLKIGEIRIQQ